jgi:hypothetical protein
MSVCSSDNDDQSYCTDTRSSTARYCSVVRPGVVVVSILVVCDLGMCYRSVVCMAARVEGGF